MPFFPLKSRSRVFPSCYARPLMRAYYAASHRYRFIWPPLVRCHETAASSVTAAEISCHFCVRPRPTALAGTDVWQMQSLGRTIYCSVKERALIALRIPNCFLSIHLAVATAYRTHRRCCFFAKNKQYETLLCLPFTLSLCMCLCAFIWEAAVSSGRTRALTWSQNFNEEMY